jgi:hypothetical protein
LSRIAFPVVSEWCQYRPGRIPLGSTSLCNTQIATLGFSAISLRKITTNYLSSRLLPAPFSSTPRVTGGSLRGLSPIPACSPLRVPVPGNPRSSDFRYRRLTVRTSIDAVTKARRSTDDGHLLAPFGGHRRRRRWRPGRGIWLDGLQYGCSKRGPVKTPGLAFYLQIGG